jgi:hypothetical protein
MKLQSQSINLANKNFNIQSVLRVYLVFSVENILEQLITTKLSTTPVEFKKKTSPFCKIILFPSHSLYSLLWASVWGLAMTQHQTANRRRMCGEQSSQIWGYAMIWGVR